MGHIGAWTHTMKARSRLLIGLVTVLAGFIAWRNTQHDIVWTVGGAVEFLLIPFLVACLVRGRKSVRNWDAFAHWYFWLALGLLLPLFAPPVR
jgi:hypothetical protein